jgi:hypothetical protein
MPMKRTAWRGVLMGAALAGVFWACLAGTRAAENKGTKVTLDGLTSVAPAEWKEEKPPEISRKFRVKQFRLPKVEGDKYDAEMIIFYFGQGAGGSAEDNVKRWKGLFNPPKGKKIADVAKVTNFKVGKAAVTYLDVSGTYKYNKAPFAPNSKTELRPDSRMIGVVFESEKGPYFFRLVGPAKTVAQYKKGFDTFLKSFK